MLAAAQAMINQRGGLSVNIRAVNEPSRRLTVPGKGPQPLLRRLDTESKCNIGMLVYKDLDQWGGYSNRLSVVIFADKHRFEKGTSPGTAKLR